MKKIIIPLVLFLYSVIAMAGVNRVDALNDFAYSAGINLKEPGALFILDIPESVYTRITRDDMGDMRVFNKSGSVVPHAVRTPQINETHQKKYTLKLFPLYEEKQTSSQLKLKINETHNGHELTWQSEKLKQQVINAYLLDASDIPASINRLNFSWSSSNSFLVNATLMASNDLEHWSHIKNNIVLADMTHLGEHLKHHIVEFKAIKMKYFKLQFNRPEQSIKLSGVSARSTSNTQVASYLRGTVDSSMGERAGEYLFKLPGKFKLERLNFELPEKNTLVTGKLYSRDKESEPWKKRSQVILYRLSMNDSEITNSDISINKENDAYWKLDIDQSGGGLGHGSPAVKYAYQASQLLFIARGEGPFTLAWGNASVLPLDEVISNSVLKQSRTIKLSLADLDERIDNPADKSVLQASVDWQRIILWSVLVFAALLLVWMASRLLRQMNDSD